MNSFQLLAVPKIETTTPSFRSELVRQSLEAGLDPNLVAAAISFESGFNPKAKNPGSTATGLIQWLRSIFPASAKRAGRPDVTHDDLPNLSAEQQLPFVIAYFQLNNVPRLGASASATDYYMSVLLPAFVGYPKDKVLGVRGDSQPLRTASGKDTGLSLNENYAKNSVFDWNKKGYYTVGDVGKKIEDLVRAAQGRAAIPVPLPVTAPPRPRASGKEAASSSPRPPRPALSPRIGSSRTVFREKDAAPLPRLERGSHGPAVLLLQRLLWATQPEGDDRQIDFDGEFGAQTEIWVALHQHDAGLEPDGIVGDASWASFAREEMWGPDRMGLATLDQDRDDFFDRDIDIDLSSAETLLAPPPLPARATEPFDLAVPSALPKPPKAPR